MISSSSHQNKKKVSMFKIYENQLVNARLSLQTNTDSTDFINHIASLTFFKIEILLLFNFWQWLLASYFSKTYSFASSASHLRLFKPGTNSDLIGFGTHRPHTQTMSFGHLTPSFWMSFFFCHNCHDILILFIFKFHL